MLTNNIFSFEQLGPDKKLISLQISLCRLNSLHWVAMESSYGLENDQSPVVQSIISLTSLLMTNLLTVVAKVFSDTLIFLLQKCEYLLQCKSYSHFYNKKISTYLPYFKIEILVTLANTSHLQIRCEFKD